VFVAPETVAKVMEVVAAVQLILMVMVPVAAA
jgi:hypothetical protein